LYQTIAQDERHTKAVVIIREPISKRSFGEWTMGYSAISANELNEIIGLNDFFAEGSSFSQLNSGRARTKVSFRFQPIIDISTSTVVAYEALSCGANNEELSLLSSQFDEKEWSRFDTNCRAVAVNLAARLGLSCGLHINYLARNVDDARSAIQSTLESAERNGIDPNFIVLEIDQDKLVGDPRQFAKVIEEHRSSGLRIAIDHFGAGLAGLNLLEPYRPEMICLNQQLVHNIDKNGPRQAIVLGVHQTCIDLGIDLIAKNVETYDEYNWFREQDINLIQGNLIAAPEFEQLPSATQP